MIAFRLLSHPFLLIAIAAVAMGLWLWFAGHDAMLSAGELWYELAPASLNLSQVFIQRYLHPNLWEGLAVPLLRRPYWETIMVGFIIFLLLSGGIGFLVRRR